MLVEAGLISDDGHINQAVLSARLKDALSDDLRFFPTGGTA